MQVLVFGSNSRGFHGAGSAGLAFRGDCRNTWRNDAFLYALAKSKRNPPEFVRGRLAVFGQSRGFMQGTDGASYAICTVTRPGAKRSISRREICKQFVELFKFAKAHPEHEFLMTPVGCGYAGYSAAEMQEVLAVVMFAALTDAFGLRVGDKPTSWVIGKYGKPENIRNLDCYSRPLQIEYSVYQCLRPKKEKFCYYDKNPIDNPPTPL